MQGSPRDEDQRYQPPAPIPAPELGDQTIVVDRRRNAVVMQIRGTVVLPIGAEIELSGPGDTATVVGVRLLAEDPDQARHVCLEVVLSSELGDVPTLGGDADMAFP